MGNLRSKFGKNRSTNYVTFLSTDAGRTDGRMDGWTDGRLRDFIVCPMHKHSIGQTIKKAATLEITRAMRNNESVAELTCYLARPHIVEWPLDIEVSCEISGHQPDE